jgi:hypothetical protein
MKSFIELREEVKALEKKWATLKTKKAKEKCSDKIWKLNRECLSLMYNRASELDGQKIELEVLYSTDGQGLAKVLTDGPLKGESIRFNACNDVLSRSWYEETCCISYEARQKIEADLITKPHSDGIELGIKNIKGGILDQEKFNRLDKRDDLAFFKHSGTNHVTGLFK